MNNCQCTRMSACVLCRSMKQHKSIVYVICHGRRPLPEFSYIGSTDFDYVYIILPYLHSYHTHTCHPCYESSLCVTVFDIIGVRNACDFQHISFGLFVLFFQWTIFGNSEDEIHHGPLTFTVPQVYSVIPPEFNSKFVSSLATPAVTWLQTVKLYNRTLFFFFDPVLVTVFFYFVYIYFNLL